MTKTIIALSVLFFSLFLSIPSFAALPIIMNQSVTLGSYNLRSLVCTGSYCYAIGDNAASYGKIFSWNLTGGNVTSCVIAPTASIYGGWLNSTHAVLQGDSSAYLVNNTVRSGGTCALVSTLSSCGKADIGAQTGIINGDSFYLGKGVYNSTCYLTATHEWANGNTTFITPNITDISTAIYGTYIFSNPFYKYDGSLSKIASTDTLFGFAGYPSLYKVNASTTFIYSLVYCSAATCGTEKSYLYKSNWSAAELVGTGTTVTATYPIGNQSISAVMSETVQLTVDLTTYPNGTISWYNDGVFLGNTSITANYSNSVVYSTPILADGQHYWNATFYDIYGNSWSTGNQTYFKEATSAITTVGQSLANALGVSLDYGKMMLALLISAALSGALAYYVKWQLFLPAMFVCSFFFAVAGFFPAWFTLIFVVIGGILFAKYSGLV